MKKLFSFVPVILFLGIGSVSAQTISAGGRTIKLNAQQISYLHTFNNPAIEIGLSLPLVKYNETADMIIALIDKQRATQRQDYVLVANMPHKHFGTN